MSLDVNPVRASTRLQCLDLNCPPALTLKGWEPREVVLPSVDMR